jgi:diacylglycerol O-acyltransferase
MARKPLSKVDLAWLRMDSPNNLMVITGLMTFDTPLDLNEFRETVKSSLLPYERFQQRVLITNDRFIKHYWVNDPDIDLDWHVQEMHLPPPGGRDSLQNMISELMSQPLDLDRPLWRFYVINEYEGGGALVCRLHHCIADGIALMNVLLSMTRDQPGAAIEPKLKTKDLEIDVIPSAETIEYRTGSRTGRLSKMAARALKSGKAGAAYSRPDHNL